MAFATSGGVKASGAVWNPGVVDGGKHSCETQFHKDLRSGPSGATLAVSLTMFVFLCH